MAEDTDVEDIIDEIKNTLDDAVADLSQSDAQEVYDGVGYHCKVSSDALTEDMGKAST